MKQGAPRAVAVLAGLLERAAERGDADGDICGAPSSPAAGFRGRAVPGIPVRRYAERIYRYAGCSPACFVVAYVYLDRLAQPQLRGDGGGEAEEEPAGAGGVVIVDSYSVHRLLVTAVMVAAKFMDDRHYNNAYFARVGGVEVAEMNALELRLLFALRFRLNVAPDTFARYCAALEAEVLLGGCPSSSSPGAQPPPVPAPKHGEEEEEERRREHHARQEAAAAAALRAAGSTAAFATAAAGTRRRLAAPALVEIAQ